jgi:hypothetical protein
MSKRLTADFTRLQRRRQGYRLQRICGTRSSRFAFVIVASEGTRDSSIVTRSIKTIIVVSAFAGAYETPMKTSSFSGEEGMGEGEYSAILCQVTQNANSCAY